MSITLVVAAILMIVALSLVAGMLFERMERIIWGTKY
jgi:hypothetical protein